MVVGQMRVDDVESVMIEEALDGSGRAEKRKRILRFLDDRMREVELPYLRLELVTADVGVVRIDTCFTKRRHLRECRSRRASPAIAGREVEDFHRRDATLRRRWRSTPSCSKSSLVRSTRKRSSRLHCRRAVARPCATSSGTSSAARSRSSSKACNA